MFGNVAGSMEAERKISRMSNLDPQQQLMQRVRRKLTVDNRSVAVSISSFGDHSSSAANSLLPTPKRSRIMIPIMDENHLLHPNRHLLETVLVHKESKTTGSIAPPPAATQQSQFIIN